MFSLSQIDTSWTLFLDRDGVLNYEKKEDYIRNWDEFHFYDGVPAAIASLNSLFIRIVIATNQKGIGKGLMTHEDLKGIHDPMLAAINNAGGKIDQVYYCPDLADDSPNRKPQPGMAFMAKADFPEIDLNKSIMVGNRISDMKFGRNAGMKTVFLATTHPDTPYPDPMIDLRFDHLVGFAEACIHAKK
ncbi:MAG: phosphatase [Sphingobacteriia bacterium 24-36-13]|jgi:histidinol-phosphate phosphatase family protein|uniref:D-glycero-alpha-D-manno-heptose-1,7-bisphosphate 7-phosphatase n=1 Tax=Sediminibacterium sp. TaxID=1917865 RepID=UPI000BD0CFC3|nr:HAD family hydrolase [Sediminibacterium sp.]OYY12132.1 MAG: phosphatase [Sphingobacteriia bacterium 35-36-14]OYZ55692.1 MAG: phosphatase [Sphingobacteriia bacterium 24-36-13]OZA65385.1 MAG: phosphatase [Sphingobacteriia bacterium 39-36-14]HQS23233.1 HAD family hydrolase [Sediminibacterium sp.]HQS34786.1 HAD family hydrolase [Sediminibacterium sp.]